MLCKSFMIPSIRLLHSLLCFLHSLLCFIVQYLVQVYCKTFFCVGIHPIVWCYHYIINIQCYCHNKTNEYFGSFQIIIQFITRDFSKIERIFYSNSNEITPSFLFISDKVGWYRFQFSYFFFIFVEKDITCYMSPLDSMD